MTLPRKSGLLVAAPTSGSGKTVLTLAMLRALKNSGLDVTGAKAGPDYIDPAFHEIACGVPSVNIDPWAMDQARIQGLALNQSGTHLLVEGMMGLFDGAADGSGSAAYLSRMLEFPVVLVVDASKQSHSVAALVRGFRDHDQSVRLAAVLLNKVGSSRHEKMLRGALAEIDMPVVGAMPRDASLNLPERHLGLVQAGETEELEAFIENAASILSSHCDMDFLKNLFSLVGTSSGDSASLPPIGQRISIARDEAFSFIYPHMLADWRSEGVEIDFFSPLADEGPSRDCDGVFLPGGYPELHCGRLASASRFKEGMIGARDRGTLIYGECGGYMVLGEGLIDSEGNSHAMTGLLKLETSFAERRLHLGYRKLEADGFVLGQNLSAHEFHYTSVMREDGDRLFFARDALGEELGAMGLRDGNVMGSYMHVIDRCGNE